MGMGRNGEYLDKAVAVVSSANRDNKEQFKIAMDYAHNVCSKLIDSGCDAGDIHYFWCCILKVM